MKKARFFGVILTLALAGLVLFQGGGAGAQTNAGGGWVRIGALPAGVWSLASDAANVNTLYALGDGGISSSSDSGATWAVCNREASTMQVVTPLPGQAGKTLIYATTPGGLRLSDDGCRTWRDVPTGDVSPSGAHIRWLAPYPNNHSVLYAGMDGLGGLYRSTDSGGTWKAASQGLPPGAWVTSLAADMARPTNVIIGVYYPGRNHLPTYIYHSTDGGVTWRSSSLGLYIVPNNGGAITGLAWSGDNLFAATLNDGLYVSTDQGATWQAAIMPRRQTPDGGRQAETPLQITTLAGTWDGTLLISTPEGAFQSLDGARTWQSFGPVSVAGIAGKPMLLAFDPNSGRALLASTAGAGGIWSYQVRPGSASLPTSTAQPVIPASPTPPPPPQIPTSTPTNTSTSTPTATRTTLPPTPTPTPLVPADQGQILVQRAQPLDPSVADYFEQTGHNVRHGFRDFWRDNGGVAQFGYPLTEEFVEGGVDVQYFERARLEYQDGKVAVGRIGAEMIAGKFFRPIPFFPSQDTNVYFGATGHSIEGPFLDFWRANGREPLLGLPLSESFNEDGSDYQWFERARLEWHPYLPKGSRIALGNIGTDLLKKRGWLK